MNKYAPAIIQMDVDQLDDLISTKSLHRDILKKTWSDRITCNLCKKNYLRSNKSRHENSKYHLAHKQINDKLIKLIFN